MTSKHILLAGDSIFDNDGYVGDAPGVIEQLRQSVPQTWSATKVAVDGDCIRHVKEQVAELPTHITDLIVSVGGNDARQHTHLLAKISSPNDLLSLLKEPVEAFRAEYAAMLHELRKLSPRLSVCTIYTAIPFEDPLWRTFAPVAINCFNEAIKTEATAFDIPVIQLDQVCVSDEDFSTMSPIEPSTVGGQKIVDHIVAQLMQK